MIEYIETRIILTTMGALDYCSMRNLLAEDPCEVYRNL